MIEIFSLTIVNGRPDQRFLLHTLCWPACLLSFPLKISQMFSVVTICAPACDGSNSSRSKSCDIFRYFQQSIWALCDDEHRLISDGAYLMSLCLSTIFRTLWRAFRQDSSEYDFPISFYNSFIWFFNGTDLLLKVGMACIYAMI